MDETPNDTPNDRVPDRYDLPERALGGSPDDFARLLRATRENDVPGVFQPDYATESKAWCPSTVQVRLGVSVDLQALALDRYGNEVANVTFAWSSTIGSLQISPDGRSASLSGGDHTGSGEFCERPGPTHPAMIGE